MLNASSSKVRKESLKESSLESKVSSQQSTEEMGSEDSDRCKPNPTEEINTKEKRWYELLKKKVGLDINAKEWMKKHPELAYENKSELLIRLAYELCLAKNTEYDPENENEEQNNKYIRFDTQRIFALFEVANELIGLSDRKNFIEFVCQKGNVQLLEMICKKESSKGLNQIDRQYIWQGTFAGYSKLIDLLQYVVDKRCSQEIVLCIAKKVYGYSHILYNGEQYLNRTQVPNIKKSFNYQDSVVKDLLKQAVKLSYKDAVPVMLSGDIYHSIRLMKWKVFKGKPEFIAAYNMIKEAVADVISSGLENGESCKDSVQNLLDQGIEIDLNKMSKEDLMYQLEYLEKKVISENVLAKKELVQELKKLGKEKGEVRLRLTVVGAFISTLFFNYQDKVMKGEPFTLKVTPVDKTKKGKILDKLKKKISKEESIDSIMLELIKLLHSGNHIKSNWFFREVLAKVVNENLDKLKAVCAAICKEPMEELLRGEKIHENVTHVLQFFGVEVLTNQIVRSEIPSSCASIADQFMKDINVYSEKEAKEDCSSDELTFSGLTRKIIRDLKKKKDLTDEEKKDLILKAVSKIKEGINILADGTATNVDVKDIFLSFELINSKIEKEQKREVIELVCQKGNVQLLEMICKKESEDLKSPNYVEEQYKWQGTFTGYSKLIDLLQYVIDNQCSQEIVLCIAKKIYGYIHILCNGGQYLEPQSVAIMNGKLNYQNAIVKELLKQVITLNYGDTVSVMLSGDIYHSIRLMKWKVFEKKPEFIEAYNMIKETVADVISSWVEDKQSCKDFMLNLLDQGIEIDLHKMSKEDLMYQLEYLEKKVISKNVITKKELIKKLEEIGKEKGEVRLKSTIVGRLISTLFFNFQDKMMKGELFILKINQWDNNEKGKILDELKISNGKSIEDIVLELVKLLNSAHHFSNNWFFREVLAKVVNENLDKLKAVCAAICKEPMEELLRGEEIHENVIDVLQFFGVDTLSLKRDLGSVESQETFEYTDSSSTTETNKLSSQDIVDIAKYYYKWKEPINGKYLEGMNEKVFFTCTDISSLEDKLKHYKKIQQKDLIFTSIINTGKEHWVTLVVARNVQGKDVAYYCDSFGKKKIPSVLKKALKIDDDCIGISQIKQQEDEYNCGIFALANAYKITGMIKGKSFTEINIELKGKFDTGQLRKEFAKKVKEMRQKSGVDSEEEVHEPMEVEDGVDALSNRQLPAETSHDLPELSIAGTSRIRAKVLSSVLPDLKAAERKNNKEVMQNNCRRNQDTCHTQEGVSVLETTGNILNNKKVMRGAMHTSGAVYKGRNWIKAKRRIPNKPEIVKFSTPPLSEFINMFSKDHMDKLLEYEFNYERLGFLCLDNNESSTTNQAEENSDLDSSGSSLQETEIIEYGIDRYNESINLLKNGKEAQAVSILLDLSKGGMPQAQYAFAVIKFKNLWVNRAKRKEGSELDKLIPKVIAWLNDEDHDKNLRPLNRSLLLKVQLYDIGGYGEEVENRTGLNVDDLLNKVLYVTQNTEIKFSERLVEEDSLVALGKAIQRNTEGMNDCEFIIRCAMYEILKKKILREGLHKEHSAIEDAFSKICNPFHQVKREFIKIFKYVSAEMMYGHAISLLKYGKDTENKKAIGLLDESYKSGHLGSSYLLWTLVYKNKKKSFNFVFTDAERYKRYFSNFEEFAKSSVNETALRMVANEYLKDDSRVVIQSKKKAQEILEGKGYQLLWQEIFSKLDDKQQLSSIQVRTDVIRELNPSSAPPIAGSSLSYPKTSTPLQHKHVAEDDLSSLSPEFDRALSLESKKRKVKFSESPQLRPSKFPIWDFDQIISKRVVDGRDIRIKFISDLDSLHSDNKNILQPRTECFFVTKNRNVNMSDSSFHDIEEYCKQSQWGNIVQLCQSNLGSKDSKVILKAHYNKGEALFLQGRYADAQRSFGNALKSAKTPEQILLIARSIAGMHAEVDKYSDAILVLKKAKEDAQEKGLNPSSEVSVLIDNDIRELSKERLSSSQFSHSNISASSEPDTSIGSIKLEKHMTNFMDFK